MDTPQSDEIDEAAWEEARRRAEAIRAFLSRRGEAGTTVDVVAFANELGVSQATAYRLIALFRQGGSVTSLVERKRGRPMGHRVLDQERDTLVKDAVRAVYMTPNRPPVSELVRQIRIRCLTAGLKPPHRRTIVARLKDVDLRERARRRGEDAVVTAATAVPGELRTARPLEIMQIDHTKADLFVVDEETREPIGRPWLTLAIDVHSRMVAGIHLTMDAPSRLSTSLCLLHAVFDKSAWLKEREIAEPWPVAGLPDTIHVDNGADFRSRAFKRGCDDAGVAISWRPPGEPRFGGHIERLIGTQMGKLHLLPGTTFSNAEERGQYDPKRHAALTLRELERYIALEIVGAYHQSIHGGLARPPLAVWRAFEDRTPLRLPQDRQRFWLTFLPEYERALRPTGIHLFGLRYWSPALSVDVGRSKRKLLVKYDPRDLSRVFVRRPSGGFVEARYADLTLPPVTLHEAQAARRHLLAKGRREVGMEAIVRTAMAQRKLVDDAIRKTNAARRRAARGASSTVDGDGWGSLRGVDSSKPVISVENTD
jgi:putative transposase